MLRKYWKVIVICIVIVFSVGTFYIKSTLSASSFPEFTIKSNGGDREEMDSLVINAEFSGEYTFVGKQLQIDFEGSDYWKEKSFFKRLNEAPYKPLQIIQMQKNYRNFMRGKREEINSYYEDEASLVYVDISHEPNNMEASNTFHVSVLDKENDTKTSFSLSIDGAFSWVSLMNMQMKDDKLSVITRNDNRNDNSTEVYAYTIDVTTKELINDEMVASLPASKDDVHSDVTVLSDNRANKANDSVVLKTTTREFSHNQQVDGYTEEITAEELITYDLGTKKATKMDLADKTNELGNPSIAFGSNIYFTRKGESGFEVNAYNIENDKAENIVNLPNLEQEPIIGIQNGKIYLADSFMEYTSLANIIVADLKSGQMLFEGEIIRKNPKPSNDEYNLYLYDLEFK